MATQVFRLERRIEKADGCWYWRGLIKPDGYGKYNNRQAHRAVYEAYVGPIPVGLQLDHLCRVLTCVNPEHLEPVTDLENKRRRYLLVTRCKSGHEFTPENTYVMPGGHRSCRKCRCAASCRYRKRLRSASAVK